MEDKRKTYYPKNRAAWRSWLQKNHAIAQNVWVIIYKKRSGKPGVTYAEVVEEALCFGWIDSKPNKRDEESYFLFIAPRKPKSVWSALNKIRIEKLLEQNLIMPAGLQKIEAAKKDGTWNALDKVDAMEMPAALQKAFAKNNTALKNFEQFPPSAKKGIYQWMASAKTEATQIKRIAETVTLAAKNIRANQWTPKTEK
jgi:uncharacterized protein YdeI (YjbR/CyaY-like superfamily)